ncbi:MAG: ABC-2 transporter permease [Oscillospiraceae bacterium]
MKGLILKDFYLSKKSLIMNTWIFVLLQFLVYIVRFAFIYGNLAKQPIDELTYSLNMVDIIVPLLTTLISFLPLMSIVNSPLYQDFNCKWNMFAYTTPYTENQMIKVKYLESMSMWIVCTILGTLLNGIYYFIFKTETALFSLKISFLICFIVLAIEFILLIATYNVKKSKTVEAMFTVVFSICWIAVMFKLIRFMEDPPEKYRNLSDGEITNLILNNTKNWISSNYGLLFIICISLAIILGVISYKVCVSLLKRRDRVCGD